MSYADQLLASGETILRRERQHWIFPFYIAGRWVAIAALVTVVGFVLGQFVFRSDGTGFVGNTVNFIGTVLTWITIIALVIAAIGFVFALVRWFTQEYILTNRRVIHVVGVINKQSLDSSLEMITDAQIIVPWLGRILGFGDLRVMTASEAGIDKMRALHDPIGFKKAMMETKHDLMVEINTMRAPAASTAPAAPAPVAAPAPAPAPPPAPVAQSAPAPAAPGDALTEPVPTSGPAADAAPAESADEITHTLGQLAQLRDAGAITPEEYEAKKAELLSRI
jgi:hypothetical protein